MEVHSFGLKVPNPFFWMQCQLKSDWGPADVYKGSVIFFFVFLQYGPVQIKYGVYIFFVSGNLTFIKQSKGGCSDLCASGIEGLFDLDF